MRYKGFHAFLLGSGLAQALADAEKSPSSVLWIDYSQDPGRLAILPEIADHIGDAHLHAIGDATAARPQNCSPIAPPNNLRYDPRTTVRPLDWQFASRPNLEMNRWTSTYKSELRRENDYVDMNIVTEAIDVTFHFTSVMCRVLRPALVIIRNNLDTHSQIALAAAASVDMDVCLAEAASNDGRMTFSQVKRATASLSTEPNLLAGPSQSTVDPAGSKQRRVLSR